MNRQFDTHPLVCPHCGHVIGEQAYFQTFEMKVAAWLQARVAPPSTKGYDVHDSLLVPDKTFQVKYAQAHRYQAATDSYPQISWVWSVKRLDPVTPDFFVLFGIGENQAEYCFLYSREDLLRHAWRRGNGAITLRVSAKEKSDRKHYQYTPKIWRFHVKQPELNLADRINSYQSAQDVSVFMEKHQAHIDEIRTLHAQGMSQKAIGKRFNVSSTTISRILRGVRH